ncbi:chalcone-flavanone isomerase-domain-containing protein [Boletus coccyginus]|nr:chalcone-flavanone isomerase-domain-containing protein [Boletus coccyginus]
MSHILACAFSVRARPRSWSKPVLYGVASLVSVAFAFHHATSIHFDAPRKDVVVDPATSVEFPKELRVPSRFPSPPHSLLGVGVRTVSFLGINVYSVGFYADLTSPKLKIPISATPDEKINYLVRNASCVLRIVPTRHTSYTHLRDSFMRTLAARLQLAKSRGTISAEMEVCVQSPLRKLKSIFPNTKLSKGNALDVHLTAPTGDPTRPRNLVFSDLGAVESDWVAEEFVLAYFEGEGISPPMKKATVERLSTIGN